VALDVPAVVIRKRARRLGTPGTSEPAAPPPAPATDDRTPPAPSATERKSAIATTTSRKHAMLARRRPTPRPHHRLNVSHRSTPTGLAETHDGKRRSAIVTIRKRSRFGYAEDITAEEANRRADPPMR
jgi:hypothetical protein